MRTSAHSVRFVGPWRAPEDPVLFDESICMLIYCSDDVLNTRARRCTDGGLLSLRACVWCVCVCTCVCVRVCADVCVRCSGQVFLGVPASRIRRDLL